MSVGHEKTTEHVGNPEHGSSVKRCGGQLLGNSDPNRDDAREPGTGRRMDYPGHAGKWVTG